MQSFFSNYAVSKREAETFSRASDKDYWDQHRDENTTKDDTSPSNGNSLDLVATCYAAHTWLRQNSPSWISTLVNRFLTSKTMPSRSHSA